MSLHKVLAGSRALLAKNAAISRISGEQAVRNNHVVCTPPTEKVSFGEKMVMAFILTVSISFIPAWVIYHVPEYQDEKRPFKKEF